MIAAQNTRMFAEAAEAPAVVERLLAAHGVIAPVADRLRRAGPSMLLTAARGSSDHAATYLKHLVETRLAIPVASASPSVASIYRAAPRMNDMVAVALSQSGRSPDLLATVAAAKAAGGMAVALVNAPDTPLAALADAVVPLGAGTEASVAATKSFLAMLAASAALVAAWGADATLSAALAELPAGLRAAWECDWTPLADALVGARGLYVIGRGPGFGAAQEIALKLKETCGLHAEAFSAAEVRHGPMALIGPDMPLLVLRQEDEAAASSDALIADMRRQGAPVWVAGERGGDELPVPGTLDAALAPVLAVQAFYRAAAALSVRRGHDPDRPPLLAKVTETR